MKEASALSRETAKAEKAFETAVRNTGRLQEEASERNQEYQDRVTRRLQGQASELGRQLREEISQKGEALCPVCHTVWKKGQPICLPESSETVPDREEVDSAWKAKEAADKALQKQMGAQERAGTAFEEKRDSLLRQLKELLGESRTWEEVRSLHLIEDALRDGQSALEEKQNIVRLFSAESEEADRLNRQAKEDREAMEKARSTRENAEKTRTALEAELPGVEQQLSALRLKFASREEAEKTLETQTEEMKNNRAAVDKMEKRRALAARKRDETEGSLRSLGERLEMEKTEAQQMEDVYRGEMLRRGFENEEAYRLIRDPMGEDMNGYLNRLRKDLDAWRKDLAAAEERVATLAPKVDEAEPSYPLKEKKAELEAMQLPLQEAVSLRDQLSAESSVLERGRKEIRSLWENRSRNEAGYRMLDHLHSLSQQGSSGKLAFSRYVLSYTFREILEQANHHLDRMTGGRFRLRYRESAADNRAKAGLGIEVTDELTGETRDTATLSGGESFQVSLALALALSDIVGQRSGGRQAEAMFIDEGFGTLGEKELNAAMNVLSDLAGEKRQVGIISHVTRLEEWIPTQIRVRGGKDGSRIEIRR